MNVVWLIREASGLTQQALARLAGTSQSAIAAYETGAKVPNLRTLRRLASVVGVDLEMRVLPPMTREDRRSLTLHRSIARKLLAQPEAVLSRARQNVRKMRRLHPGAASLLNEWDCLLRSSVDHLASVMTDAHPRSRELRQVTPFAGVLDARERTAVLAEFRRQEESR